MSRRNHATSGPLAHGAPVGAAACSGDSILGKCSLDGETSSFCISSTACLCSLHHDEASCGMAHGTPGTLTFTPPSSPVLNDHHPEPATHAGGVERNRQAPTRIGRLRATVPPANLALSADVLAHAICGTDAHSPLEAVKAASLLSSRPRRSSDDSNGSGARSDASGEASDGDADVYGDAFVSTPSQSSLSGGSASAHTQHQHVASTRNRRQPAAAQAPRAGSVSRKRRAAAAAEAAVASTTTTTTAAEDAAQPKPPARKRQKRSRGSEQAAAAEAIAVAAPLSTATAPPTVHQQPTSHSAVPPATSAPRPAPTQSVSSAPAPRAAAASSAGRSAQAQQQQGMQRRGQPASNPVSSPPQPQQQQHPLAASSANLTLARVHATANTVSVVAPAGAAPVGSAQQRLLSQPATAAVVSPPLVAAASSAASTSTEDASVSKPGCPAVAPAADCAAESHPCDLSGRKFEPAGKVSNAHVVGRVPIGFTPLYPTVDLKSGKHASMQVFNGASKCDFLRHELPLHRAILEDSSSAVRDCILNVLGVVDHGDAALVFKEPFVTDLHTQLRKQVRIEEEQARDYFAQIVRLVAEMHDRDVVLGPGLRLNTLVLTSKDMLKLKLSSLESAHTRDGVGRCDTQTYMTSTCLAYAPPEIVAHCQDPAESSAGVDKSCDMWALGVILYSMLCGSFPFVSLKTDPDSAREEILDKITAGRWLVPAQPRLSLPAHTLLRLLLSPDPSGRLNARALLSHPWLASSPIISSGKISSSYDACAATAFASAASESLLQSMQTRTQSAQDQCVPC